MILLLLSCLLSFCQVAPNANQIKHTITNSNQRDTVMLQSMTVKQFKDKLAEIETGGYAKPYQTVNRYGYLGKYQISKEFLAKYAGVDKRVYLSSPWLQEKTMNRLCRHYLSEIIRIRLNKYVGKEINGITVTLEGLMAGYHQHPVALVKWLRSDGKTDLTDGNKCPVSKFVETFSPSKTLTEEL